MRSRRRRADERAEQRRQRAFTVRVPAGVRFVGKTVNGEIDGEGLNGDVSRSTVNGRSTFSTTVDGDASTVNGSIRGAMGSADWSDDAEIATVNGSITLDLPLISTPTSSLDRQRRHPTDFPMTVTRPRQSAQARRHDRRRRTVAGPRNRQRQHHAQAQIRRSLLLYSRGMEGIITAWGRILAATRPPCRSRSPASARSAARAATPTVTSIWAATSPSARSPTTKARSSSIGSSRSSTRRSRSTSRSSAANRWSASAS